MALTSTISKWGNGQGIRLPKALLEMLQWGNDDKLEIIREEDGIKIKKIKEPKRKTIVELFQDYENKYEFQEIDWGSPQGDEVW